MEPDSSGHYPGAWTYKGLELPFLDAIGDLVEIMLPDGRKAYNNRPTFKKGLQQDVFRIEKATSLIHS